MRIEYPHGGVNKNMQDEQLNLCLKKHFPAENVADVRIIGKKVIVQIKNMAEDKAKAESLKKDLAQMFPQYKSSVIFITQNEVNVGVAQIEKWRINGVKKIIGVASGKGGVGKSTTAVNLALALADCGKRVALVDADIYGPSLPTMLGYEGMPLTTSDGENFSPFMEYGIQSVSIGSLIDRNTPLIWRGAKACDALEQLLTQTLWDNVDVLVIDMPPGTGDILITLSQHVDFADIVIVSTPQDIALIDAIKGVNMFKKIGVPILGIVENMSYFLCPHCGEKIDIFSHNGAKQIAEKMGEVFLGAIPLDAEICAGSDNGAPIVAKSPDSPHTKAYRNIAENILRKI